MPDSSCGKMSPSFCFFCAVVILSSTSAIDIENCETDANCTAPEVCLKPGECHLCNCSQTAQCLLSYNETNYIQCNCTEGELPHKFGPECKDDCEEDANCDVTNSVCINGTCVCTSGFSLIEGVCDENECDTANGGCVTWEKGGGCENKLGSFECYCIDGFSGDGTVAGTGCTDPNTECTNYNGTYGCPCLPGFDYYSSSGGPFMCHDRNECSYYMYNNCDQNADCQNTPGSFTCTCKSGYQGDGVNCTNIDLNECLSEDLNDCDVNAVCTDTDDSFSCTCKDGFTGNGGNCTDIDECSVNNGDCGDHGECNNTQGSRECVYNVGSSWTGHISVGSDMKIVLSAPFHPFPALPSPNAGTEMCETNQHTCHRYAHCTDTLDGFACRCNGGFDGNGTTCTDIDECAVNNGNCGEHSCINYPGGNACEQTSD